MHGKMFLSVIILYLDLDQLLCAFPEKAVNQVSMILANISPLAILLSLQCDDMWMMSQIVESICSFICRVYIK